MCQSETKLEILQWNELTSAEREAALKRAPANRDQRVQESVAKIVDRVRLQGDQAIRELTLEFDGVPIENCLVSSCDLQSASDQLPADLKAAIDVAFGNIQKFHHAALPNSFAIETSPGVECSTKYLGIETVGMYAPGGATPLPSSVLMMGVPAMIAGCGTKVLCSSPNAEGKIDPAIAYAAKLCQVDRVFLIGGAQAIAAMAYGTQSVPACDKIFGPGSVWVTEAKRQVAADSSPVTIDMAAGPSEVLVVADDSADPEFIAADMLAQLEHGTDSQAILVTDSSRIASQTAAAVQRMAESLSRVQQVQESMSHSRVILTIDMQQAMVVANRYAAEHLILQAKDSQQLAGKITAAGSVFVGKWTPEVLGDYCSGTNHVLPTCGLARSVNGLSTADFMKRITFQSASADGLSGLAQTATTLARWEQLTAHALAVDVRLSAIDSGRNTEEVSL